MKKLTFKTQVFICSLILIICFICSATTKIGVITNIGFAILGLLFAVNPVWPASQDHLDHKILTRSWRIGGLVVIFLSLITRLGLGA